MPALVKNPFPLPEFKSFQRKMYAVYGPDKEICLWSLSGSEIVCHSRYGEAYGESWKIGSERGYSIAEVIVSIIPVISKSSTDE